MVYSPSLPPPDRCTAGPRLHDEAWVGAAGPARVARPLGGQEETPRHAPTGQGPGQAGDVQDGRVRGPTHGRGTRQRGYKTCWVEMCEEGAAEGPCDVYPRTAPLSDMRLAVALPIPSPPPSLSRSGKWRWAVHEVRQKNHADRMSLMHSRAPSKLSLRDRLVHNETHIETLQFQVRAEINRILYIYTRVDMCIYICVYIDSIMWASR